MGINEIVSLIAIMSDKESGGDNALNGFEFQVSSAIYLVFEQYKENQDFALMYEKLEDFIIINNKINLYQSKGVNFNVTLNQLTKNRSRDKENESIIEKMYDNFLQVKEAINSIEVETNLIISESQTFSKDICNPLIPYDKHIKNIYFSDIGENGKNKILESTRHSNYEWSKIKARRLIPKSRHEEVTRVFIEDVITEKLGENKINSKALYTTLVYEINRTRKNKSYITSDILSLNINNFSTLETDIKFDGIKYLLNQNDQRNLNIIRNFEEIKTSYEITNHPLNNDINLLYSIYNNGFNDIYEFVEEINSNNLCKGLIERLNKWEVIALALLVIIKKEGI